MSEGNTISASDYQRAVAEATRRKERIRQLEAKLAEQEGEIAGLKKDLGDALEGFEAADAESKQWQEKFASSPDEWRAKYEDVQKQLKERDLRSRFDKSARGKVRDDALDAAWKLAGLPVDGDLDDDGLGKAIGDLVSSNGFLAPQPEPAVTGSRGADASGRPHANQSQPGPGAVRGSVNMPMQQSAPGDPIAAARQKLASMGASTPNGAFRLG